MQSQKDEEMRALILTLLKWNGTNVDGELDLRRLFLFFFLFCYLQGLRRRVGIVEDI